MIAQVGNGVGAGFILKHYANNQLCRVVEVVSFGGCEERGVEDSRNNIAGEEGHDLVAGIVAGGDTSGFWHGCNRRGVGTVVIARGISVAVFASITGEVLLQAVADREISNNPRKVWYWFINMGSCDSFFGRFCALDTLFALVILPS